MEQQKKEVGTQLLGLSIEARDGGARRRKRKETRGSCTKMAKSPRMSQPITPSTSSSVLGVEDQVNRKTGRFLRDCTLILRHMSLDKQHLLQVKALECFRQLVRKQMIINRLDTQLNILVRFMNS